MTIKTTRYSKTRVSGARCTAATKLTEDEKQQLHYMAVERAISDYELTRRALLEYIRVPS